MDIIKFLNSRDIAEHLQQINYQFSPEEAMFFIHEGRNIPLAEKHAAYEELIRLYPNHPLKERLYNVFKNQTVSSFLRMYIEKENQIIEDCKRDGDDAIYFANYFSKEDACWIERSERDPLYHSFYECLTDMLKEDEDGNIVKLTIYKKYIQTNRIIELELLPDSTVLTVDGGTMSDEDDFEILNAFEMMWVNIPTPFKKGDILIPRKEKVWNSRRDEDDEDIIVLTDLCTWGSKELAENGYRNVEGRVRKRDEYNFAACDRLIEKHEEHGDVSDMLLAGFFVGENAGTICHDHTIMGSYLDYEYYRGELKGRNRILKAVSSYIKGDIDLELLVKANMTIYYEEQLKSLKRFYLDYFTEDALELAGIKNGK